MNVEDYLNRFKSDRETVPNNRKCKALDLALEIRKFEIELYWKRATYFWAFIAAAFGGYGLVQKLDDPEKTLLSVLLSCLGLVFSFGWYCVNRASKRWQQNWENHVDILEDAVLGPLYKVIIEKLDDHGPLRRIATGSAPLSVSKINQMISLFVVGAWVVLIIYGFVPTAWHAPADWLRVLLQSAAAAISATTCWGFVRWGGTGQGASRVIIHPPRAVEAVSNVAQVLVEKAPSRDQ
jgi:hypothetical protein